MSRLKKKRKIKYLSFKLNTYVIIELVQRNNEIIGG